MSINLGLEFKIKWMVYKISIKELSFNVYKNIGASGIFATRMFIVHNYYKAYFILNSLYTVAMRSFILINTFTAIQVYNNLILLTSSSYNSKRSISFIVFLMNVSYVVILTVHLESDGTKREFLNVKI